MSEENIEESSSSKTTTVTTPPKYSRYRSVRRAANPATEDPPSFNLEKQDAGPTRSMSRYRRSRTATKTNLLTSNVPVPPVPRIPGASHIQSVNVQPGLADLEHTRVRLGTEIVSNEEHAAVDTIRRKPESEQVRRKEEERQLKLEQDAAVAFQEAAEIQRLQVAEQGATEILVEQKRKDLERLEAELEAAAPTQKISSPRPKLGIFSRMKGLTSNTPPVSSTDRPRTGPSSLTRSRPASNEPSLGNGPPRSLEQYRVTETPQEPQAPEACVNLEGPGRAMEFPTRNEQRGGDAIPRTDAPVSASNAGERVS